MKKTYSANDNLRNLAQNLNFKVYVFDDPKNIGPEIKLREKSKYCEIDAVMLYDNIVCIVGINKGKSADLSKEIERFLEKLDKVSKVSDIELKLETTKKREKKIKQKLDNASNMLKDINEHICEYSKNYDLILKKIFFCPNKQVEDEITVSYTHLTLPTN